MLAAPTANVHPAAFPPNSDPAAPFLLNFQQPLTEPFLLPLPPIPPPAMAPSGPVSGWSVEEVAAWLTGELSLPAAVADAFKENAVAGGGAFCGVHVFSNV